MILDCVERESVMEMSATALEAHIACLTAVGVEASVSFGMWFRGFCQIEEFVTCPPCYRAVPTAASCRDAISRS